MFHHKKIIENEKKGNVESNDSTDEKEEEIDGKITCVAYRGNVSKRFKQSIRKKTMFRIKLYNCLPSLKAVVE